MNCKCISAIAAAYLLQHSSVEIQIQGIYYYLTLLFCIVLHDEQKSSDIPNMLALFTVQGRILNVFSIVFVFYVQSNTFTISS